MKTRNAACQAAFSRLVLVALCAAIFFNVNAASAQTPGPTTAPNAAADPTGGFPWLALGLFIVMAVILTTFRSHPKYPKKATGNCCAPVVEDGARPFRILEDELPINPKKP